MLASVLCDVHWKTGWLTTLKVVATSQLRVKISSYFISPFARALASLQQATPKYACSQRVAVLTVLTP